MKPKIVYKYLGNYSDNGLCYMQPWAIHHIYSNKELMDAKTFKDGCHALGLVYGPIVIGRIQ